MRITSRYIMSLVIVIVNEEPYENEVGQVDNDTIFIK